MCRVSFDSRGSLGRWSQPGLDSPRLSDRSVDTAGGRVVLPSRMSRPSRSARDGPHVILSAPSAQVVTVAAVRSLCGTPRLDYRPVIIQSERTRYAVNGERHLLGWLALPFFAVANGLLRDLTSGRTMDRDLSYSIAVAPLLVVILLWTWFLARRWPLSSRSAAWIVGAIWLLLTQAFEFALGTLWRPTHRERDALRGFAPITVIAASTAGHAMVSLVSVGKTFWICRVRLDEDATSMHGSACQRPTRWPAGLTFSPVHHPAAVCQFFPTRSAASA